MKMDREELRKKFTKVVLKHFLDREVKETRAAIVDGLNVYIGVARCDKRDQFNRYIGRQISLGRAFHEREVHTGVTPDRGPRRHSETVVATSPEDVEKILDSQVFKKQ